MTEPDATPPKPPHPKAVGKKGLSFLKGRPAWHYVLAVTVLVGVAYVMWKRQQDAGVPVEGGNPVDPNGPQGYGPLAGGDTGGGYVYASPTQGAFGGYDYPIVGQDQAAEDPSQREPLVINVYGAEPVAAPLETVPATPTPTPTGGGPPARSVAIHHPPSSAPARSARQQAQINRKAIDAGHRPAGLVTSEPPRGAAAPAGFPHRGPHGWFRNERDKRGRFHLYQSGHKVYVK